MSTGEPCGEWVVEHEHGLLEDNAVGRYLGFNVDP